MKKKLLAIINMFFFLLVFGRNIQPETVKLDCLTQVV